MRRALRILIVLSAILLAAWLGVRAYLHSRGVANKIEAKLSELYGGPVHLATADIGLKSSTLHGVRLLDADGRPWLSADSVNADVSLWEMLRGTASPKRLDVSGAKVTLRFDAHGRLLTRLPEGSSTSGGAGRIGLVPDIRVEKSQLTLQKEGGPGVVLTGVKLRVTPESGKLVLRGEAANPEWGKLDLAGSLDEKGKDLTLTVRSGGTVHVTPAMLDALPFVPASVWREVQAEGDTPVKATLRHDPSDGAVHYRVDLEPKGTTVTVPAADFKASGAAGKLVIDDGLVELRGVEGSAYDGTVALDADLDFRGNASQLDFSNLKVHGLDVGRLPPSWGVPKQVEGRLDAAGDINITLEGGKVSTEGDAHGEIRNARIAGEPTAGPIQIDLAPEGAPLRLDDGQVAFVQAPVPPPPPRKKAGRVLTMKVRLEKADLGKMAAKFAPDLPFALAGRLSFQGEAAIPLDTARDAKTYRFKGKITVADADLAGVRLERAETDAVYEGGVLRLGGLHGTLRPDPGHEKETSQTFQGKLAAQFAPAGDLTADLKMDGVGLSGLAEKLGVKGPAAGVLSATVSARVPVERLRDPAAWQGSARITVPKARVFGWALEKGTADVRLEDGTLTLADVKGRLEGGPLTGSAEVSLKEPYRYRANVEVRGTDLAAVQRLAEDVRPPVEVRGKATLTAELRGTLEPFRVDTSGTVSATGLKIDDMAVRDVKFAWEADNDRLKVKDLHARLYGGEITGGAVVPLAPAASGDIDLTLKGIDVGALLKESGFPLPIEGQANGTVKGKLPAAPPGKERPVDMALDLKSTKLQVQGVEAEGLEGKARYQAGELSYDFRAKTLGGRLEVEGKVPRTPPAGKESGEGRLKIRGIRLDRLAAWLHGGRGGALPLGGTADADLTYRHAGPKLTPVGAGRVVLSDLSWDGYDWLPRVQGDLELTPERLLVRDATGGLGEGIVRLRMGLARRAGQRSWFQIDLERAEAARLLAPWPELRDHVQGPVDASLRGTIGREWAAHGSVVFTRGKIYGAEVSEWRLPVGVVFLPQEGRGRLEIRESGGQVAHGRVAGGATYRWGLERRLEGKLTFTSVELGGLLHEAAESAHLGGGKITGSLDFSGPGLGSLNDLTAALDGKLSQTQALDYPVLRQLTSVLRMAPSSTFQSGVVRARLAGGVVRVERLSLHGGPGDVFMSGTVTTQGRLDLNVHANVGRLALNAVGVSLPFEGTIPVRMLNSLNNYLSSRLVQFRVLGTVRSPTIQIRPLPILQEEGIRFFLRGGGM